MPALWIWMRDKSFFFYNQLFDFLDCFPKRNRSTVTNIPRSTNIRQIPPRRNKFTISYCLSVIDQTTIEILPARTAGSIELFYNSVSQSKTLLNAKIYITYKYLKCKQHKLHLEMSSVHFCFNKPRGHQLLFLCIQAIILNRESLSCILIPRANCTPVMA